MTTANILPPIAVLGGDKRQIGAAKFLAELGFQVSAWGIGSASDFSPHIRCFRDWREAVRSAEVLLLPLPATVDGVRLSSPLSAEGEEIRLDLLLDEAEGKRILGGRLSERFKEQAEKRRIECTDYFDSEVLQLKNALPTAEGAIEIAMRELPVTIDGVHAAVIGFGRIGELLSQRLVALGAHVSVFARRREALTHAALQHCNAIPLYSADGKIARIPSDVRVIFNTVPVCLFGKDAQKSIPKECLFIDLASAPGGIDRTEAEGRGIRVIWATSLPGKYAPETAGRIIAETARDLLESVDG